MPNPNQPQPAFDLLGRAETGPLPRIVAIVGDERFLKRLVLNRFVAEDDELERYAGGQCTWQDVADELATRSLFGTGPRRVLVTEADDFVTRHRSDLERYAQRGQGILILDLQSLPGNTRLYKQIAAEGWIIECRVPQAAGQAKSAETARLKKWLETWSVHHHGVKLLREAAELLVDLVGWDLGMLDQELAKLALFVLPGAQVDAALVQRVVGGWRTQTTWDLLDAAADGNTAEALLQLDHLLQAGEPPQALFGSIAWSLRRYAAATRIVQEGERRGQRIDLKEALVRAGFRQWPPNALDRAAAQLKQMTRHRSGQLYRWLLDADLALKGSHATPSRGRFVLEQLFFQLAKQLRPTARRRSESSA